MRRDRPAGDRRLAMVAVVLVAGLLAVMGKLVIIQGLQAGKYSRLASDQRDSFIKVTPRRGTIFDREGEVMAISEDVVTVYATPYQIKDKRKTAAKIAEVLGEDTDSIEEKISGRSGFSYVARKIDVGVAKRLKKLQLKGIGFIDESKRFYPMGKSASQVLGLVDMDNQGQAGLEAYYEDVLGGKCGELLLERDAAGNPIPGSEQRKKPGVDGVDIELTVDKDVQLCVEEALSRAVEDYSAKAATAVVMDCNTGDIIAMASNPTFDPNNRVNLEAASMRNRAVTDVYEPGSAMKIVTAVAALQEGVVNPDSVIFVPSQLQVYDKVFKDAEPKPSRNLDFSQIIIESSNVGTIQVALQLGAKRIADYLSRFGMGHRTGVDFPGEVGGIVPSYSEWTGTSAPSIGIGQGISVTPLQMACAAAAIANGGRKVCPHFLKAKITDKGVKDMGFGGLGEEVVTQDSCTKLTGILERVVSPGGTGSKAAVSYYRVAGKTGTAAKPLTDAPGYGSTYMATFVGFAPVESPRLVVIVVLDEPSPIWGGETSAPVFSKIMGFALQHMKVPPSWGQAPQNQ